MATDSYDVPASGVRKRTSPAPMTGTGLAR